MAVPRAAGYGFGIPYWDWANQQAIPARLATPAFRQRWGLIRSFNPNLLPDPPDVAAVLGRPTFAQFQPALENLHNLVHQAVGGYMMTDASPVDPIFWLHHASVDRLWWQWQTAHPGQNPPNVATSLQPAQHFGIQMGVPINQVLNIVAMGYQYI